MGAKRNINAKNNIQFGALEEITTMSITAMQRIENMKRNMEKYHDRYMEQYHFEKWQWMKTTLVLLLIVLVGLSLSGCQKEPPLRIGSNVWPGYELLYLARERGYFDNESVRMVEMPSATVNLQSLAAGNIEGACLTLDEVITARADGLDLSVVAILDISVGADALMVKPDIKQLSDLRGRRIGVEQTAVGAVMLSAVLEEAGLKPDDVKIKHINVNAHRDAYLENKVDAVITFEPVISQLAKKNAQRLFDSSAIPGRIIDVIAIRPDVLKRSPNAIKSLIKGHFAARKEYLNNTASASEIISRRLKLPPADVPMAYDGLDLPDVDFNKKWMQGEDSKLEQSAVKLADIMLNAKLLPKPVDVKQIVDGRFLPK